MKALLILCVLVGICFAREARESSLDEIFKNPKSGRISYERMHMAPPPSVAYSCTSLFKAMGLRSYSNVLDHFYKKSLIVYHSALPAQGVYKGKKGAMRLGLKFYQLAIAKMSSYEIRHVDEARGICIVDTHCKGMYRRSNNSAEMYSTNFIKFELGKVKLWNIVDHDYNSTTTAFQTKAENKFDQVLKAFFGGESMDPFVAHDLEVQLPNLYPTLQHQQAGEKNVSLALRGKEAFGIFSALAKNLVLNRTATVKYLWGNDTSLVSVWILKPSPDFHIWNLKNKKMAAWVLTAMYVCTDFNEQGLMKSFRVLFNRPFMPWQTHQVGLQLKKVGEFKGAERKVTALKETATGLAHGLHAGLTGAPGAAL